MGSKKVKRQEKQVGLKANKRNKRMKREKG